MGRIGILCACLSLLLARGLTAQGTGAIAGQVYSNASGVPVEAAIIVIDSIPRTQTDAQGRFRVEGLSAGEHTISVRRIGYAEWLMPATVRAGATHTMGIGLGSATNVLRPVTVIGTRTDLDQTREQMAEIPGGVSLVEAGEIRSTRQANLKDVLQFTPGVYVQPRFGAADEAQISVRGSGLRNNFHARGINLLVNGMPYRNADGFTDFESLELLTTEAIEVYKGANALRYGGSTMGGAINLDTKTGYSAEPISAFAQLGGYGFSKAQISSGRVLGDFNYYASYARTEMDNYREWSDQRRDRVNVHAGYRLGEQVDARTFYFFARVREHLPGALTRAEFDADPEDAVAINVADRWGRDYDLHHLGLQLRAQLSSNQRLEISPYTQYRDIDHPIFEVIAQVSRDYGAEIRYENTAPLAGRGNRFTLGVQPAYENMDNRQFVNEAGEHGTLSRDEKDEVRNLAVYAENSIDITNRLTALVGARWDYSKRTVEDFFLGNGDQSAERVFDPVSPRIGLLYQMRSGASLFANASHTVEPPLLLELSSFGNPGGFIDLDAQRAWQYEIGVRSARGLLQWELSLFDIELRNEILNINVQPFPGAPFTVPSYRNADETRHSGLEAGIAWRLPGAVFLGGADVRDNLTARLAYTLASFSYVDDAAYGDNDLPGAPRHHVTAELKYWHPSGLSIAPTVEWVPSSYFVNSENTVENGSWSSLGVRAEWAIARAGVTAFVEGRNLLDEQYSGSVQVDNAAGRFFEPADRRSVYAGLRWSR